jgi:hypothetical protein
MYIPSARPLSTFDNILRLSITSCYRSATDGISYLIIINLWNNCRDARFTKAMPGNAKNPEMSHRTSVIGSNVVERTHASSKTSI